MDNIVYSVKSHRRIAHYEGCRVIRRIAAENTRTFRSVDEARSHGYRLCSCCAPIVKKLRRERRAVRSFCEENQLEAKIMDGALHVISRHDYWCLITCGGSNRLTLYHRNKRKGDEGFKQSSLPGFHAQFWRRTTVLDYLIYISEHDAYRDEHPSREKESYTRFMPVEYPRSRIIPHEDYQRIRGTKKYRKKQRKKERQRRAASIRRVYALIDELSAQTV